MAELTAPVLEVSELAKHFRVSQGIGGARQLLYAVDGVSLRIGHGEILGLVGESGSGKSTVGKCIVRMLEPTAGQIRLLGEDITHTSRRQLRPLRRRMHMVFQDPYSSLNPRMTIRRLVGEPLLRHGLASGSELDDRVQGLLERCGLNPTVRARYPHELSGGQRQRVSLARSLSLEPDLLIADEPISALDVSVQASIMNLLLDLQEEMGFSCLFITHDLSAVEFISDQVAVMYLGKIVERASAGELFAEPKHPYSQALLSAAVVPDPDRQRNRTPIILGDDLPSPMAPPPGCSFHTRCPIAQQRCRSEEPALTDVTGGTHVASCHLIGPEGQAPLLEHARVTDDHAGAASQRR